MVYSCLPEPLSVFIKDSFGPVWATKWFRLVFAIPAEWRDQEVACVPPPPPKPPSVTSPLPRAFGGQVHLRWDSSSEAMVYVDGEPQQAFNAADGADKKAEFVLRKKGQVKVRLSPLPSS